MGPSVYASWRISQIGFRLGRKKKTRERERERKPLLRPSYDIFAYYFEILSKYLNERCF